MVRTKSKFRLKLLPKQVIVAHQLPAWGIPKHIRQTVIMRIVMKTALVYAIMKTVLKSVWANVSLKYAILNKVKVKAYRKVFDTGDT